MCQGYKRAMGLSLLNLILLLVPVKLPVLQWNGCEELVESMPLGSR